MWFIHGGMWFIHGGIMAVLSQGLSAFSALSQPRRGSLLDLQGFSHLLGQRKRLERSKRPQKGRQQRLLP